MKLITLNVEGLKHKTLVLPFLVTQNPDIICLQEAPQDYIQMLEERGYTVTAVPRCLRTQNNTAFTDHILIASKTPFEKEVYYYHKSTEELPTEHFVKDEERNANHQAILLITTKVEDVQYSIGTTHFTWTPDGDKPGFGQRADMKVFMEIVKKLPSHIMCGDFNIPRHHNALYKNLTEIYTDTIPETYKSSLDKTLHRVGNLPEKQTLFNDYMVDYVFTQTPYKASDVHLEFRLSDHAAVVATITSE